ncbi:hypothetical protein K1X22_07890 [Mycolicibacterium farcinogenes]|nr:hypothetical protein K1X22_07890 [Mycolicibacterium farcinogenes]
MPNRRRRKLSTAMSAVAAVAVASPVALVAMSQLSPAPQEREFTQAALVTDLPGELMSALSQGLSQFGINLPPMPTSLLTGSSPTPTLGSPTLTSPGLASPGLTSPGLTAPGLTAPGMPSQGLTAPGLASPDAALTSPNGLSPHRRLASRRVAGGDRIAHRPGTHPGRCGFVDQPGADPADHRRADRPGGRADQSGTHPADHRRADDVAHLAGRHRLDHLSGGPRPVTVGWPARPGRGADLGSDRAGSGGGHLPAAGRRSVAVGDARHQQRWWRPVR